MKMDKIYNTYDKEPLERIVSDGGFCAIFKTIGCIGDSLSSGELEYTDENGNKRYHDFYEFSWGQYMARTMGNTVYNFSKGGMSAKNFIQGFADGMRCFTPEMACQAYIIALGVNDLNHIEDIYGDCGFGEMSDINLENFLENKLSFIGCYAQIIQRIKDLQPKAKIFLMTMPRQHADDDKKTAIRDKHAETLYKMAELFDYTYVIDFRKYAPLYDEEFDKKFRLGGHLNIMGYMLTAKMTMSYIDFIVRHNMEEFVQTGFIGTPYTNKC